MTFKLARDRFGSRLRRFHHLAWRILRLARLLYPLRTEHMDRLPLHGPALVIAPHASYSDAVPFLYTGLSRLPRFVGSSFFLLANAPVSWLAYLGGSLPIDKHVPDPQAARRILRMLAAGDVIALFPEGERSWAGLPIDPILPCVKFLARLRAPVFVARLEGSYDHWPRWETRPRWRRIVVRLEGPVAIPGHADRDADPGRPPRWWDEVYRSGGRVDAREAREAIAALLEDAAEGEAARLDLRRRGRLRHVTRLIVFCPACAAPAMSADAERLACDRCGAAWRPAGGGGLRREGASDATPLSDLFVDMLATLRRRAPSIVPLEGEATVVTSHGGGDDGVPGTLRVVGDGVTVTAATARWDIPLDRFGRAELQGYDAIETHGGDGTPLTLVPAGGGLRFVLIARALAGLSWGPFAGRGARDA